MNQSIKKPKKHTEWGKYSTIMRSDSKRTFFHVILITAVFLGALAVVLGVHGPGRVIAEIPWFVPLISVFNVVSAAAVAFLAFGRYRVLRDPVSYWSGLAFAGFCIGTAFYVATWPGLLPGGRSMIGHAPGTSGWIATLASNVVLGGCLIMAALARTRSGRSLPGRSWFLALWFLGFFAANMLLVVFEDYLPPYVSPKGAFAWGAAAATWSGVLIFATGTVLSTLRYLRSDDSLLAYQALKQLSSVFVNVLLIIGSTRYDLSWYLARLFGVGGGVVVLFGLLAGYVRLFRTEQEKSQRLCESEEEYRRIVEMANEGIWAIDEQERTTFVNQRMADMLGYALPEMLGRQSTDFVPEEDRDELRDKHKQRRAGVSESYEFRFQRKDGSILWGLANAVPLYKDGKAVGSFGMITDITERKSMEEELRRSRDILEDRVKERTVELTKAYVALKDEMGRRQRMEDQLRQSQRMEVVGTLAGGIAHNFNNLLAAIVGFADVLKDRLHGQTKERRAADRIFEAGIRGRDLVKQLLAFSRQMQHEKTRVLLGSLVKETLKLLRASIPTTVAINLEMRDDGLFVMADPVHIQQILMNLSTNAADAMREKGGTLTIGLATVESEDLDLKVEPGRYAKLSVRDTGVGMTEETKKKIFDPFFSTKAPGEGTGLGLSTVIGIVDAHHGALTVDSVPGVGSTFSVYLPLLEGDSRQETRIQEEVPRGKGRVLFVDDEESLVELAEALLEELGYEVTATTSSARALALFMANPESFDAVITDQTMPELTGLDLAQQLIEVNPDIPILMITGFSHLVDAKKAQQAGIKGFLMKPLTKGELARTLQAVLSADEKEAFFAAPSES